VEVEEEEVVEVEEEEVVVEEVVMEEVVMEEVVMEEEKEKRSLRDQDLEVEESLTKHLFDSLQAMILMIKMMMRPHMALVERCNHLPC